MGEIKSVKVDNWGVFFLQKLQNFFNKTDYCDLTLQFKDNSQLKVHRLVLSACTDFFNVLEQTCELMDDALVMPIELQADVVVPIVNFMYTGTLEFELRMYGKLLKTAKEMNMTVLLKLLEAHKRTMEGTKPSTQRPGSPKTKVKRANANSPSITKSQTLQGNQQSIRRLMIAANPPARRIIAGKPMQTSNVFRQINNVVMKTSPKMQRGPTRFENVDSNMSQDAFEGSFDAMSYESKPIKEEPEEYEDLHATPTKNRSSPFEQLRKGYNNNKRPAVSTFISPPAKKPNIEDVKEFSEQQRVRKQIAAEYGDDAEYDGVMDDEFHHDDDDDEPAAGPSSSSAARQQLGQPQASIIIKQSPNEKPTIVVKDSTNSKMDHAKIISEVLRQYPHLVKSNKNIKLKIMPNSGAGQTQKIIVKKDTTENSSADQSKVAGGVQQARQQLLQLSQKQQAVLKTNLVKPALTVTSTRGEAAAAAQTAASGAGAANAAPKAAGAAPQKRRIDSKTMHALIAQGAENTTGPWLCLRCGVNGRPISIPSYRGFRRHLINTHKEVIDSALCEHCGWRSSSNRTLNHHMLVEHKISTPLYVFPNCEICSIIFLDQNEFNLHNDQVHARGHKQQCIYCNKVFTHEMALFNHMKMFHKECAREDGVIDFSDEEMDNSDEEMKHSASQSTSSGVEKKIKIISDISLPSTILKLEEVPASIDEEYANESGPKFVNADGNEMVLTAEQREEIMSQLEQDHDGGVVMVLNETPFAPPEGTVATAEEPKADEHLEDYDDHQIYNEFPQPEGEAESSGNNTSADDSALGVAKEDEKGTQEKERQQSEHDARMEEDHMEWAENVISAHDADENGGEDEEAVGEEDDEEEEEEEGDDEEESVKKTTAKADSTKDREEEEKVSSSKSPSDNAKEIKKDADKEDDISLKLKMLTGDWSDDEIDEDEDVSTVDLNEKENTSEQPTASAADIDIAKKPTPEVADEKDQDTTNDSEKEPESTTTTADPVVEEKETNSTSESEKTADEIKKPDEDEKLEKQPKEESRKLEETVTKRKSLDATIEAETEQKVSPSTSKSSSRRTSNKDDVPQTSEKRKSVDGAHSKPKPASRKQSKEDPLDHAEPKEDAKAVEENVEKNDTVTSTKSGDSDPLKTVDKVNSLISEWADEEDDI